MKKYNSIIGTVFLLVFLVGCKNKYLNYPYAENNTSTEVIFNHTITDDYKWLEGSYENKSNKDKWLTEEADLCDKYFKSLNKSVYHQVQGLCAFERYTFIKSEDSSFYYCGTKPFINEISIYKYDLETSESIHRKSINLPFQPENNLNALVFNNERHIAIIGGTKGNVQSLYIYNLHDSSTKPVHTIENIIDKPLNPTANKGFLYTTDNLSSETDPSGLNSLYHCSYKEENDLNITLERIYSDEHYNINKIFDSAYDNESNNAFVASYENDISDCFIIESIHLKTKERKEVIRLQSTNNEDLRLGGTDNVNLYIIGTDKKLRGTLYMIDKKTLNIDTIINNNSMPVQDFSLVKDHALIYFQRYNANRAYLINKNTKSINEIPIEDGHYYRFYRNKKSDRIYFQKESLINPREVYSGEITNPTHTKRVNERRNLPFNPDNYVTENITIKSEVDGDINIQLTYKKGMIRDGSNPLFLCAYLNSDESFLDKFYLSRVLYMDHGYIFVQRAKSDSKRVILLENRIKDIYTSIQYLVNEKYTSKNKIALFGKEYGATAIMQLLNKYDDIEAPTILMDGIYDLIKYNDKGRLLYNNERLFHVNSPESFGKLLNASPYHNVVNRKNYPPILLMSSNENLYIPKSHTYKMTAKLQMRTRGYNPIVMLTPKRINKLDEYEDYTYTMFIEHAFWFLSHNLGIRID